MKGENFQMKPEEQRVLGILATIFGAIALLGSWIPFINYHRCSSPSSHLSWGLSALSSTSKNGKQWLLSEHPWQLPLLYFSLQVRYYTLMSTKSMPRSLTVPTWIRVPQWNAKKKAA